MTCDMKVVMGGMFGVACDLRGGRKVRRLLAPQMTSLVLLALLQIFHGPQLPHGVAVQNDPILSPQMLH